MQPFTDANLIQDNTGTAALVSSTSVTTPGATLLGNAGIVCMMAQTIIASPNQWDIVASAGFGILAIMCRSYLPGGETSWVFNSQAGSPNWAWAVEEWDNIALAPVETSVATTGTGGASSVSTGTTGAFNTQFVMGIAAFGIAGGGGAVWPTISYSNGFTETDSVSIGTGANSGDLHLSVARLYGDDSDPGPWSCTATFTGSMTSKTSYAALAVFRAIETDIVTTPLCLSS